MAKSKNEPHIHPIRITGESVGCPFCGEKRITKDIHKNHLTFVCGFSSFAGNPVTTCQREHFQQFLEGVESVEESIWEGVW